MVNDARDISTAENEGMPPPPDGWWYISFATDVHFLGAAVVEGCDERAALARTHQLGINPGGEALLARIPESKMHLFTHDLRDRLLDRQTVMDRCDGKALRKATNEERANLNHNSSRACQGCQENS